MKINGITDIFFDLDHTLWDFDRNSALTFLKIFQMNNVNVNLEEFLGHYEPINLEYWKRFREDKIEKQALRFGRLNDTFLAIGYNADTDLIFKLSEDYITHLSSFNHLFDYSIEILNYLSLRYNLHIITNGFEDVQKRKLVNSGIDKYFRTVTNSEMVGVKKPNPKIFNYALSQANAEIDKSIMIGDSYEADILGAKSIGMHVVFFDTRGTSIIDDIVQINTLDSLEKYL